MAFCDYHPCDLCGEHKTFYDANMDYEQHDDGSLTYCGHKVYAICHVCRGTHEIIIVPTSSQDELTSLKAENERLREALEDAKQSLSVAIYGLPEMLESNALSDEEGMVPSLEAAVSRMDEALGKAQQ